MMKKFYLTAFFSLVILCVFAQKKVLADKIIATVGDKVVLKSEIENSILDMQRQNIELPPNA
ncbi:MAG: peptidylprolyl isomerase, partial [Chitinophagaceae bacterium]|nr:peptidylprolyl isomerase [Chitinophagaceae bacterium]